MKFKGLVPGSVTTDQLDFTARAVELPGQKFDERLIGRRVHRRRGDLDLQLIAQHAADFAATDRQIDAIDGNVPAIELSQALRDDDVQGDAISGP